MQGTCREQARKLQGARRKHAVNMQGTLRQRAENIQGTSWEHLGNNQGAFRKRFQSTLIALYKQTLFLFLVLYVSSPISLNSKTTRRFFGVPVNLSALDTKYLITRKYV
jgi:hypothetical protein